MNIWNNSLAGQRQGALGAATTLNLQFVRLVEKEAPALLSNDVLRGQRLAIAVKLVCHAANTT